MGRFLDINLEGDRALFRQLRAMRHPAFERVVNKATHDSMERMKTAMVAKVSSGFFKQPTGRLANAMKQAQIIQKTNAGRTKTILVLGISPMTRRAVEEIIEARTFPGPGDVIRAITSKNVIEPQILTRDVFYPAKVELGTRHSPPKSFMRSTFLENRLIELERIGKAISKGIDKILSPLER